MSLTLVCLPSTYLTTPMQDHSGCTGSIFLKCATDGEINGNCKILSLYDVTLSLRM